MSKQGWEALRVEVHKLFHSGIPKMHRNTQNAHWELVHILAAKPVAL
jgi:hypothetical protein